MQCWSESCTVSSVGFSKHRQMPPAVQRMTLNAAHVICIAALETPCRSTWCSILLHGRAGLLWEPERACMPEVWLLASAGAVQGASQQEPSSGHGVQTGIISYHSYAPPMLPCRLLIEVHAFHRVPLFVSQSAFHFPSPQFVRTYHVALGVLGAKGVPRHMYVHVRSNRQNTHTPKGCIDQTACHVVDQVNFHPAVVTGGHIAQHDKAATVFIGFPICKLSS